MKRHAVVLSAALLLSATAWADDVVRRGNQTVRVTDDGEVVITDTSGDSKRASKVHMSKSGEVSVDEGSGDAVQVDDDGAEEKRSKKASKRKRSKPQIINIK